jgi:hypothetical protein
VRTRTACHNHDADRHKFGDGDGRPCQPVRTIHIDVIVRTDRCRAGGKKEKDMRLPPTLVILAATSMLAGTNRMTNELAPLAWFVGTWQCAGQFSNGRPIHSREIFSAEMDGHWLRMRHADAPPDRYAADEWWGYDHATRQFVVTVFDNTGGVRHYVSSGWTGTTLSLRNTATSGYIDRFEFQRSSDTQYQVSYAHLDGRVAWQPGDELACRRDAGPPA